MPSELAAARNLGASRGVYREAVRSLAAKGLVESRTKTGTKVLPKSRWHLLDPDVLSWSFSAEYVDSVLLRDLIELRGVVEPAAAALAAERASDADLKTMEEAIGFMRREEMASGARSLGREFQLALNLASRNSAIIAMSDGMSTAAAWTAFVGRHGVGVRRSLLPEHVVVFDALKARQPEVARAAMAQLVFSASEGFEIAVA